MSAPKSLGLFANEAEFALCHFTSEMTRDGLATTEWVLKDKKIGVLGLLSAKLRKGFNIHLDISRYKLRIQVRKALQSYWNFSDK